MHFTAFEIGFIQILMVVYISMGKLRTQKIQDLMNLLISLKNTEWGISQKTMK